MIIKEIKKYNLKNYEDIKFIYQTYVYAKLFIDNHNDINSISNLDEFITLFSQEFKIDVHEYRFIISCLLEYDYVITTLTKKMNFKIFKKIIVRRVIDTLNDASKSPLIKSLVNDTGLYMKIYSLKIDENYKIIKTIIEKKKTKFNYCYLFDNIKYFQENAGKLENYFRFVSMILYDFHANN